MAAMIRPVTTITTAVRTTTITTVARTITTTEAATPSFVARRSYRQR
jgi:hypothetical protein